MGRKEKCGTRGVLFTNKSLSTVGERKIEKSTPLLSTRWRITVALQQKCLFYVIWFDLIRCRQDNCTGHWERNGRVYTRKMRWTTTKLKGLTRIGMAVSRCSVNFLSHRLYTYPQPRSVSAATFIHQVSWFYSLTRICPVLLYICLQFCFLMWDEQDNFRFHFNLIYVRIRFSRHRIWFMSTEFVQASQILSSVVWFSWINVICKHDFFDCDRWVPTLRVLLLV